MSKPSRKKSTQQPPEKLGGKAYEKALKHLHVELVKLQEWVVAKGLKVCIVFEGRDGAGKGGTIKAITERVSPRVFRVVALPAPTDREKTQMFLQRYVGHLPAAGEVVIFDRSWYNRAGVERVMGFCSGNLVDKFLAGVPVFEKVMVESGIILIKYWLEVSAEEQTRRWRIASTMVASCGSFRPWTSNRIPVGMTTPRHGTTCSRPRIQPGRRGSWRTRTTNVVPA